MKTVVIGTIFVDIKGFPLSTFIPAGRNAGKVEQNHGGVGRNIAESLNNLGANTILVTLADHTGISTDVIGHLKDVGVNCDYIMKTDDGMGTWLAVFDEHGDVYASISKRPDLMPILDILNQYGDEIFEGASGVLPELDMEEPLLDKIFELAERHHVKVYSAISNMTIGQERIDYFRRSDCLVCNQLEAGILFDEDTEKLSSDEMLEMLIREIKRLEIPEMIVTMGEDGCIYASIDGESGYCPAQKVKVVDTTGAGDSFFAGLSYALQEGRSLKEACTYACGVSAQVIQSLSNVYIKK